MATLEIDSGIIHTRNSKTFVLGGSMFGHERYTRSLAAGLKQSSVCAAFHLCNFLFSVLAPSDRVICVAFGALFSPIRI